MTPSEKIINETKIRLKNGNLSVLAGAFLTILLPPLIAYTVVCIGQVFSIFLFPDEKTAEIISVLSIAIAGAVLFFTLPILLGFKRIAYLIAKGEKAAMSDLFYCFKTSRRYFDTLAFYIQMYLRKFSVAAVLMAICVGADYGNYTLTKMIDEKLFFLPTVGEVIIVALCVIVYILFSQRYYLAAYSFIENDCKSTSTAIRLSIKASKMKKYRKNIFKVFARLIPCYLVSLLVIPTMYTVPKIQQVYAVTAKWLIVLYKNKQNPPKIDLSADKLEASEEKV